MYFKIYKYILIIFAFLLFSSKVIASDNNCFKYYLYFDFTKCSSCETVLLKHYISEFEKVNKDIDFTLITKTLKQREFEAYKQNFNYKNIINDTKNQFTEFTTGKTLPIFFVTNSEDRIVYSQGGIKKNNVNLNDIFKNFKCINIEQYQTHKLVDSSVFLYRPTPPILNQQQDNFVVLDLLDKKIKEFNINSGNAKRIIEVDSVLKYYLIRDSVSYYRANIPEQFNIETKFSSVFYDKSNNLIVTAKAFNGLSGLYKPKIIERKELIIKYYEDKHYDIIDINDSLSIYGLLNTNFGSLCLITNKHATSFNNLRSSNYPFIALLDSINYKPIDYKISFNDVFSFYNLKYFIYSNGVMCEFNNEQYAYLNPWNGLFFTFKDTIHVSLQIKGYLELIKSDNDSILKPKYSKFDYKYKLMSLNSYNNKAIVYLCGKDLENQIVFSVMQVYDIISGFEKEIVFYSTNKKYFSSYFLKIEDDLVYFLNQNEFEEWEIITLPINKVF